MNNTLLTAGIACILGTIVGGGLKAFGIEIPLVTTWPRQAALGAFGFLLLVGAVATRPAKPRPPLPVPEPARMLVVQYAQRGGPFVMLERFPQKGYWWYKIAVSVENKCGERIFVQPMDFRLFVSSTSVANGTAYYPETTQQYAGRLMPSWVDPGNKVDGDLVFEVPVRLPDGTESNGAYKIIRSYAQTSCQAKYNPT